ncbi:MULTISPECIES: hypothetical protein [Amycolatopsis]|uniref:Uncharacterized protein n=2 Tax=Amycolatopsis TaxID=1813 RepID=A0A2A9FHU0_9PSEU|nr:MULTISPECIES: hypothetical protein [Amycolatopsis]PFG50301.1 hypothetical protein ATK36_5523 [Amycolatopsis sulphurea]RJQ77181.1 hypothetical protein D5S19_29260 [Amycolatopsis panacis]
MNDLRLLARIRDLQVSLATELAFLTRSVDEQAPRPDVLRDLGERLLDLGGALVERADELNTAVLATLPAHGWLPEAGTRQRALGVVHQVGPRPLRCGPIFLALCGAACFPFYGRDPAGRTARHERCPACAEPGRRA